MSSFSAADIEVTAELDDRLSFPKPGYSVSRGALDVSSTEYTPLGTATSTQVQWSVQTNGVSSIIDLGWIIEAEFQVSFTATVTPAMAIGQTVCVVGRDIWPTAFPFCSMVGTWTMNVGNAVLSFNPLTAWPQLCRMLDFRAVRSQRMGPYRLPSTARCIDSAGTLINAGASGIDTTTEADVPNGSWECQFLTTTGAIPTAGQVDGAVTFDAFLNPTSTAANAGGGVYPLVLRIKTTEFVPLSPLQYSTDSYGPGLFGIAAQMNLQANFGSGFVARVLRNSTFNGVSITAPTFFSTPFNSCLLHVQQLNPPLSVLGRMPDTSILPMVMYDVRENSPAGVMSAAALGVPSVSTISANATNLGVIPDQILIFAKPVTSSLNPQTEDWCLPIRQIQIQFNGKSSLAATFSKPELYTLSQRNGLNMTYPEWSGRILSAPNQATNALRYIQSVGGPVLLSLSDLGIGDALAPGMAGSFAFQIQATVENYSASPVTPFLSFVLINSGFLSSRMGSSVTVTGPLTEAMVLAAPEAGTKASLRRYAGAGFFDRVGSFFSKAKDMYTRAKPALSEVKKFAASIDHPVGRSVAKALETIGAGRSRGHL